MNASNGNAPQNQKKITLLNDANPRSIINKLAYEENTAPSCQKRRDLPAIKILLTLAICFLINSVAADNGYNPDNPVDTEDLRSFTTNTLVNVRLNYESFVKYDFPSEFTQQGMEQTIQTVINKWMQYSGFRLRLRYAGTTTKGFARDREIIIRAKEQYPYTQEEIDTGRSVLGLSVYPITPLNYSDITFFRIDSQRRDYSWTLTDTTHFSFSGTLMHELGHAFGLAHNYDTASKTVMGYTNIFRQFGPFWEDIRDLRDQYGMRNPLSFRVLRSYDGGETWPDINYSSLQGEQTNTTQTPVIALDGDRQLIFFTDLNKRPAFRATSGGSETWGGACIYEGSKQRFRC